MAYKDKDKQREANKAAAKRHRQGMTKGMTDNGNVTPCVTPCVIPKTFTDVSGTEHLIDYEGRRRDYKLLKSWSNGKGAPGQQMLGKLAMTYMVIKRAKGTGMKVWLDRYLGVA